jgi:hypothetical protein
MLYDQPILTAEAFARMRPCRLSRGLATGASQIHGANVEIAPLPQDALARALRVVRAPDLVPILGRGDPREVASDCHVDDKPALLELACSDTLKPVNGLEQPGSPGAQ